jgi:hypothetical protein
VSLVIGLVLIGAAIAIVVALVAFDRWITERPAPIDWNQFVSDEQIRAYNEGLPGMKDPK